MTRVSTARVDAGHQIAAQITVSTGNPAVTAAELDVDDLTSVRNFASRFSTETVLSRSGKDLGRYFPEVLVSVRDELAPRCMLDGVIVVLREIGGPVRLDWESLSRRIHPAQSRVTMLAEQTPAHFIGFDSLVTQKTWCHVTRTPRTPNSSATWLQEFEGAGLDGELHDPRRSSIHRQGPGTLPPPRSTGSRSARTGSRRAAPSASSTCR